MSSLDALNDVNGVLYERDVGCLTICRIFMTFGIGVLCEWLSSKREFRENRQSYSCTLFRVVELICAHIFDSFWPI